MSKVLITAHDGALTLLGLTVAGVCATLAGSGRFRYGTRGANMPRSNCIESLLAGKWHHCRVNKGNKCVF